MPPEIFNLDPAGELGFGAGDCASGSNAIKGCKPTGNIASYMCDIGGTASCTNLAWCISGTNNLYRCSTGSGVKGNCCTSGTKPKG